MVDSSFCSGCGSSLTGEHAPLHTDLPTPGQFTPPPPTQLGCPRCGAANEPRSDYCFQCGLPLEGHQQSQPVASANAYRSPRTRAVWTVALLLLMAIASAINVYMSAEVVDWKQQSANISIQDINEWIDAQDNLRRAELNRENLLVFIFLVFVAAAIAFSMRIFRASRNLATPGAPRQRFSPA